METTAVLIVGAGPSGLMLANVLAAAGVPAIVVDRRSGPTDESRAVGVHVRTLELWDKWGFAEPAIAAGVRVEQVAIASAGRTLARVRLGAGVPTPYDFLLNLPQDRTERMLAERVPVRWSTRLVGFEESGASVLATVRTADGLREITASWIVGADGASSLVRHLTGIPFSGGTYAPTAFLADVRLSPRPAEGSTLNLAKGGFVGISRIGDEWYRLFGAVSPSYGRRFALGSTVPDDALRQWFAEYFALALRIEEVGWTSVYRIHHRLADRFRSGRALLIGDAAHIHAPAGGQGLNLGVGDAVNLGWKLALVHGGFASEALIDTYEAERRPVARTVLRGTDRGFELEATSNPLVEWARRHILPVILRGVVRVPAFHRVLRDLFSQVWISYRGGPLASGGSGPVRPGDRVPYASVGLGGSDPSDEAGRTTFDLIRRPVHHLLVFGEVGSVPSLPFPVEVHRIPAESAVASRFGVSGSRPGPVMVLVRPDGHVAAAPDEAGVRDYLERLSVTTPSRASRLRSGSLNT